MSSTDSESSDWDVQEYKSYNDSLFNDSASSASNSRVPPASSDTGTQLDNQLLQEDAKRILPCTLRPSSSSGSRPSLGTEDADSSQIYESYGKPYAPGPSGCTEVGNCNDEVMINGHGGRVLPPSMKAPISVPTTQYAGQETNGDERLIYEAVLKDLHQPTTEKDLPNGLLSVSLLKHQKIALAWMLQKEKTVACSGGILADDQGLGKTISSIALIQLQKVYSELISEFNLKGKAFDLDDDNDKGTSILDEDKQAEESDKVSSSRSTQKFCNRRPQAGTLVVCPASVLRQWHRELRDKVSYKARLKVLIYHGSTRTKEPADLAKYDVVLTTYSIVANEIPTETFNVDNDDDNRENGDISKKRKQSHVSKKGKKGKKGIASSSVDDIGTLAKVQWIRVILDEAQTIKNSNTQVAKACCGLRAKKRWCLSGTPIQNSINDLFSYFRFLKFEPYANYKSFCHQIKIPISRNSDEGYLKLQAVLRTIMLRRTKETLVGGKPIIDLPPKTINLTKVDFSTEERDFYLKLETESRSQFKAYAAAGTLQQNYANIMLMLLRLRQACDHPLLAKGYSSESISQLSIQMAKNLPKDLLANLLNLLETLNLCPLCNDLPDDAVVTLCGHVFCYQCISEYLTVDDSICPSPNCSSPIGDDVVFSKATLRSCISNDDHQNSSKFEERSMILQNDYNSSKIRATLEIIRSNCNLKDSSSSASQGEGPIKTIVFSQWTRMLDLVQTSLNQYCVEYRRLDGSMSLAARDSAVKEFNTDPEVTVMLMSLKAGNVGLNMVAASHVILLDLWWNPATEDQAVDRTHRIGQNRPVTVTKLTIKDTVEDRILALQEEKRKMVASAFGEDQSGNSASHLTAENLKYLFMGVS